jgi:hypothetical protein
MIRSTLITVVLLAVVGCGGDGPTFEDVPPAPPPFDASVARGIQGDYQLTGGGWFLNHAAYSHAYRTAFDRVTVLGIEPVRAHAIRLVQPTGYGPPLAGMEHRLAVGEIEVYQTPGGRTDRYVRDPGRNLARAARWTVDASAPGTRVEWLTDGRLTTGEGNGAWTSPATAVPHWIEGRFATPVTLDQVVIAWPLAEMESPWFGDVAVADGLRSRRIDLEVETDEGWQSVDVSDHRPGGRHDGPLLQEWFGLPTTPASRLAHLDALARGEPRHGLDPHAAAPVPGEVRLDASWRVVVDPSGFGPATSRPGSEPALASLAADDLRTELAALGLGEIEGTVHQTPETAADEMARMSAAGVPAIVLASIEAPPDDLDADVDVAELARLRREASTPGAHAAVVTPTRVWLLGVDPLSLRYAAFHLVERLATRGAPLLPEGTTWRRPAFAPRVAAGVTFGEGGPDDLGFPDGYLRQFVRLGLDGIYLFQAGATTDMVSLLGSSLDPSLTGDEEGVAAYRSLIRRARAQGLGVTWMLTFPGTLPPAVYERYPSIRGDGERPYVICLSTPEGRAVVEDSARRLATRIPGLSAVVVLRSELSHTCGGRLNCPHCLRTTSPEEDPIHAVFTWVRDALHAVDPEVEVIALDWRSGNIPALDEARLPEGISLWARADRLVSGTPENDLRDVAPREGFEALLASHRPGRRIWVETQISHPFPLHAQPEVAAAPLLWQKLATLRERGRAADTPLAIAFGNGSGLAPTPMQELACTTLLWDPLPSRVQALDDVARRWFGSRGAGHAVAAWWHYADAARQHLRFPKYISRRAVNTPPGWPSSALTPSLVASTELLVAGWDRGTAQLQLAAEAAPPDRAAEALRQVRFARSVRTNLVSLGHAAAWYVQVGDVYPSPELLSRIGPSRRTLAEGILRAELENTRMGIDLSIEESWLRTHGFYRHAFGIPARMEKTTTMRRALP